MPIFGAGTMDPEHSGGDDPEKQLVKLLAVSAATRWRTPGSIRHVTAFDAPVESLSWSPDAGISVSAGDFVHNVTTKGVFRWKVNAGRPHRVFTVDNREIIWSARFGTIFEHLRNGRVGWKREWAGIPVARSNALYLVDASTIASLGGDGAEKWRVNVDDVRTLEGFFDCADGMLFQGRRGRQSMAVRVTGAGSVSSILPVEGADVLIGTSPACAPIVWAEGEVFELDGRGTPLWSHPFETAPFFFRLADGYLLIAADGNGPLRMVSLSADGRLRHDTALSISGRLMDAQLIETATGLQVIGLCKDVSSPCARPDWRRGPFNVIVTGRAGRYSVQERMISGHLNATNVPGQGFVTAASSGADRTELSMRDSNGMLLWSLPLPGRLSAGPWPGPYGDVYTATCAGWNCGPPNRLFAVTLLEEEKTNNEGGSP